MSIYRTAVNHPVTTTLLFMAFALLGVFSLMNLSINNLPEFESNTIMVMSSYQGASAEDIENNVSKVLENTLNGVSDLKNITTTSKENISVVALEFEYGVDIDVATNDVRDKLDMISNFLPDGASTPVLFKFSADDMPIMFLSATATSSINALEKILDDKVTTPLARVSGVGTVSVSGAPKREIQVYCDPSKLDAYNLTVSAISTAIAYENRNTPAGTIDIGSNTYTLRIEKEFENADELLNIVVGHSGNETVYLRDVARVQDSVEEKYQESYTNGLPAARIIIQKQSGANTVNICKKVKKALVRIQKTLPSDVEIKVIMDGSRSIINTIDSLKETIFITFLVVMLVVFVFLGRWRATFIIVLAIPISLLASIIYLFATGSTLNIVSMSALSIAIGMVVDDAIVVLENISTHLENGEKPKEAAVHATSDVAISVIASTLTMLAVFLPLTMIKGITGIMFKQLGWIVSIIMIVSTTGALTLVPMLCSRFLKAGPKTGKLHLAVFGPVNRFLDSLSKGYGAIISWALKHRSVTVCTALAIFIASLVLLMPSIKTEFFPKSDEGRISINISLPIGTAQTVTGPFAREIYDRLVSEIPEIENFNYEYGQADTDNAFASMRTNGAYYISMNIDIGSMENRERSCSEIADIIRRDLAEYPNIKQYQVSEGGGGMGSNTSVSLEVYGYEFETTDRVIEMLQEKLKAEPCISQIFVNRDEYTPEYKIDFDRTKLALNGLNSSTAASYVSACVSGSVMSYFREDGDEYNIRVRYAPEYRTGLEDIENITIYNAMGQGIKVKDLGTVVETQTPPSITRKNRQRMTSVKAFVATGYALSDAVQASQAAIDACEIPSEVDVVIAGDFEEQQKSFSDLITLIFLMIILVYMVMASQFESFMSPLVIMFSVPFALTGVLLGCSVTGTAIGVMSLIGIIILLGIVVKNGIVLIDYTILLRERGNGIVESIILAGKRRLRPILMTTLTTVLGMVPLAIGTGEGAEMWRPLGITVVWGLTISTIVTLVLIPVVYCSFSTWQQNSRNRKNK